MQRNGFEAAEADLAVLAPETNAYGGSPGRFHMQYSGQAFQFVQGAGGGGFGESEVKILPLHEVPLVVEDVGDAGLERVGQDEQGGGEGESGHGEQSLHGSALEVPHRDAERMGEEAHQRGMFDERWPVVRRRFRAHGLGGRKFGRLPHGPQHTGNHGKYTDPESDGDRAAIQAESEIGEAEKQIVQANHPATKKQTGNAPERCADQPDHCGKLEIVADDLAIAETECLEDGDLLALQGEQTRKHGVGHEGGYAQKNRRKPDGKNREHPDLVGHPDVGGMILAAVGAGAAVGLEEVQGPGGTSFRLRCGPTVSGWTPRLICAPRSESF